MRKILYLLIILPLFIACSSDDKYNLINSEWRLQQVYILDAMDNVKYIAQEEWNNYKNRARAFGKINSILFIDSENLYYCGTIVEGYDMDFFNESNFMTLSEFNAQQLSPNATYTFDNGKLTIFFNDSRDPKIFNLTKGSFVSEKEITPGIREIFYQHK